MITLPLRSIPRAFAFIRDDDSEHGLTLGELVEVCSMPHFGKRHRGVEGRFLLPDGRTVWRRYDAADVVVIASRLPVSSKGAAHV